MTAPTPCSEPLPTDALDAIRQFNAGEYYEQHDSLEALWRAEPRPVRRLYQGVLQIGVAYYQITRGNRRGALKMLMRGLRWLDQIPDDCQGVDVARLRADARAVQAALAASPDLDRFDVALLKPVHLLDAP
jgi:predicted metal-dependent hydrolase